MRIPSIYASLCVPLLAAGLSLASIGCEPAQPSGGDLLVAPQPTVTSDKQGGFMGGGSQLLAALFYGPGTPIPAPPGMIEVHTATGPDRSRTEYAIHLTSGVDASKYWINVHIPTDADKSQYINSYYRHTTSGPNMSSLEPIGGVHITVGEDASLYDTPFPQPTGPLLN